MLVSQTTPLRVVASAAPVLWLCFCRNLLRRGRRTTMLTIVACLEASQQQTFLGIVEHLFNRRAAVCVELAVGLTTFCSTLGTDLRLKPSTGGSLA